MDLIPVITASRILHVLGAIVLFGGAYFIRNVLFPVAAQLPDDAHQQLKEGVSGKWRKIVGMAIGLLILTGFYNYLVVTGPQHRGDKLYAALMGIKILLAFVVFFYASALAGRAKAFEGIRRNAKFWMSVNLLLATVVVGIAGFLKVRGVPAPAVGDPTPAIAEPVPEVVPVESQQ